MESVKNILICPLEWGLGHASRMIPLANEFMKHNHNVLFASGEEHLAFIRKELPGCQQIVFEGFKPRYSGIFPAYFIMFLRIPQLIFHIILEHIKLKRIIAEYSVDMVISDNRFGLWNKNITSVYVTHMPRIPFPETLRFLEPAGVLLHRIIIRKFDYCLIPDLTGEKNISGRLSHGIKLPTNTRYIGILSRFTSSFQPDDPKALAYNTVILSGPEPQKGLLKKKLIRIFSDKKPVTYVLEGKPLPGAESRKEGNVIIYNHLSSSEMESLICGSKGIICRSGYSTIMDLIALNKTALLIPTPGQTEQEYLSQYLSEQGFFSSASQNRINDNTRFPEKVKCDYTQIANESKHLLALAVKELSDYPHRKTHR